jgi:DNA-directed RNA polymerase subunit RPC12/RpoP
MAIQSKCEKCSADFLIITKEEEFYKEKDLPLPKMCPECRYERRISLRNKKKLLGYNCDSCGKDIVTAVEPEEGLKIYCKECHQKWMQENDCILGYSEGYKSQNNLGDDSSKESSDKEERATTDIKDKDTNDPVSW